MFGDPYRVILRTFIEGDKKAYAEASSVIMNRNKKTIDSLRNENKSMVARLRDLKVQSPSTIVYAASFVALQCWMFFLLLLVPSPYRCNRCTKGLC